MLKAHDTLFRVWELAVSFLGLPPLPLVQRENTNRRRTVQRRMIWIADAHPDDEKRFVVRADDRLTAFSGTGIGDFGSTSSLLEDGDTIQSP